MRDNNKEIIIKLIEMGEEKPTINQLSKDTGIRYKNVYDIVKKLEKLNLIKTVKIGNSLQCSLVKKMHPLIYNAEFKRRKKLFENKSFKLIHEKLNKLNFPFIALLFGSYAKGKETKGSDIDLMVICEDNREKEIQRTISLFPLNIHLILFNFEDFLSQAKSKEFNVVAEVLDKNVILIGIEDYYRMLENVG